MLSQRQSELNDIDKQIKALQQALPAKGRELDIDERELKALEEEKIWKVQQAKEARRRREAGEGGGDIQLKGRWLRAQQAGLQSMLGVEAEA